jgi:hypothetical protein
MGSLMNRIERSDFDEHICSRRKLAIDEFEIAKRRKEGNSTAILLLPSLAGRESQRGKKGCQPFGVSGSIDRTQIGDSLDHPLILSCGARDSEHDAELDEASLFR